MNHILLYCVLDKSLTLRYTETTTEHYATIWNICVLHCSALT